MLKDSATDSLDGAPTGFHHDAFVYFDDEEFVRLSAPFVHDGLATDAAIVAVLPPDRIAMLREALGESAVRVRFIDMTAVGRNPARLIPFWRDLVEQSGRLYGLSESVYPGRTAAEYDESLLHEGLLDLAFADDPAFRLCCPFAATTGIDPTAHHSGAEALAEKTFRTPLNDVPDRAERWEFGLADLGDVRKWVNGQASSHGVSRDRMDDLGLALHEICTNSIRFGGGRGALSVWIENGSLICDVADHGRIDNLLVGRVMPPLDGLGGRGVWLANQLCDLAQLRSGDGFTQVRLSTRLR
ncbi:sensor histidine kinase [Kribbella antibiotica]|uniref:Sensor histidine kinase n=1 Tax=Kribbella antibiotica TaxID=190195 RepID=A0A4R4YU32_9ACTN|nr:sensor histidine kinase [Kribbella antibiotica]TDD47799.1 sensor histidine kinase [Kribbella antibiotica]